MRRETITLDNTEGLPLSDAVRFGDLIFVSGMVAFDEKGAIVQGGIAAETRQTFRNIEQVLIKAGSSLGDILKVNIILTNAADFDDFNVAYRALFPKSPPARISMVAGLTIDALLEVDVIAGVSS